MRNQDRQKNPRKAHGGIKARSERGEFAKNWWARRWLIAMENIVDPFRLRRGQRYARMGQVLSIEERRNTVTARVQGSRSKPYKVKIEVIQLSDRQWERVLNVLASQAIFAAQLLAGEMPPDIEEAFSSVGVSLFPLRSSDLITECSCPDKVNPCKHIAATHYILGDRFDEDPFLLFRLRGRTQQQILDGLRRHRNEKNGNGTSEDASQEENEEEFNQIDDENMNYIQDGNDIIAVPPSTAPFSREPINNFWQLGDSVNDFTINVQQPDIKLPVFKRLGEPDISQDASLEEMLSNVYQSVSQAALIIAYHGEEMDDSEPD